VLSVLVLMPFAGAAEAGELLDVVFVLDNSGSMRDNDPEFLTRAAVEDFAGALANDAGIDARVGVVIFDDQARLVRELTTLDGEPTPDWLSEALALLDFSGQRTNSPAGVERALYELQRNGREAARQAIVLLSDGKIDTGDRQRDLEADRWLREDLAGESAAVGVRIFGVAFTERADFPLMQALARRTSARYYRAFAADELAGVIDDVLEQVSEADLFGLAALEAGRVTKPGAADGGVGTTAGGIDVAAGPGSTRSGDAIGLLALIPASLLLAGASLVWLKRSQRSAAGEVAGAAPPPAQLLDFSGRLSEPGRTLALRRGRTRIGRDPHNDIVLEDDAISSEHAAIEYRDGRYWLEDRRSTNGTRLGDERLAPDRPVALKGGDHVRFANVDLMFVLAGYVPGGATVFLSSSTHSSRNSSPDPSPGGSSACYSKEEASRFGPPSQHAVSWAESNPSASAAEAEAEVEDEAPPRPTSVAQVEDEAPPSPAPLPASVPDDPSAGADAALDPATKEVIFAEERERLDPAAVIDLDPDLASVTPIRQDGETTDVGPSPALEPQANDRADAPAPIDALFDAEPPSGGDGASLSSGSEAEAADTNTDLASCLDFHLARVAELSPEFSAFMSEAFDEEMRAAIGVAGGELAAEANREGRITQRAYTARGTRYLMLGVPSEMDEAQGLFGRAFGGFTRLLTEELQSHAFLADRCRTLAVVSFGCGEAPWVSLSIVPEEGEDQRIDLLSYELLSPEEIRAIEPSVDHEISQSGIG
jgi:pSer/pThr/pTyr-binding forkhead associated (FHA) protein/Mg-chelatase subunit ChlD